MGSTIDITQLENEKYKLRETLKIVYESLVEMCDNGHLSLVEKGKIECAISSVLTARSMIGDTMRIGGGV